MDDINKYGVVKIPDNITQDEKRLVEALNILYYTFKALQELQKARKVYYDYIPWYNIFSKIKQRDNVQQEANKLHFKFKQYEWARNVIMINIFKINAQ